MVCGAVKDANSSKSFVFMALVRIPVVDTFLPWGVHVLFITAIISQIGMLPLEAYNLPIGFSAATDPKRFTTAHTQQDRCILSLGRHIAAGGTNQDTTKAV
ncbi:hypothetical protein NPIL_299051 [Nephila pilipes]|uniref:Uncharacterized protein n=1 Tax=Nephila pilipes TaxID=299642 RepID=A0A8X6MNN6_NEPPI|nr:hypothetical protein NPIL_299051 [Nephila pilipes]